MTISVSEVTCSRFYNSGKPFIIQN